MTRKEQLRFCTKCENKKSDNKQGIICNLTQAPANFEESCENFQAEKLNFSAENVSYDASVEISSENAILKLKAHQDFYYAFTGGLFAAVIGAVLWAAITLATQYQIGIMAIGLGFLVGQSVGFFGAGIDKRFGFLGATLALIGCLLGNLFIQVGFIAQEESLGYFETLSYLTPAIIADIYAESFSPIDLLFYGIAIYEGYRFAFRKITAELLARLKSDEFDCTPPYQKLRMPLAFICVIILTLGFF